MMGKDGEQACREMYKSLKIPERYNFMMAIRGAAKQG